MTSQVLSKQTSGTTTFAALLCAHAALTRRLNAQLSRDHGLTINDFEVLLRLARAADLGMRRVDLAQQVVLSASGITRLLDGLEKVGLVERSSCLIDRRVVYAVLTEAGLAKLREASASHFRQVDELFGARFDEDELVELSSLLSRLGEDIEVACSIAES